VDGVRLRGIWLNRGHRNAILINHSTLRSKNQFFIVLLAEWLSKKYDVFAFDARGHYESEGAWGDMDLLVQDIKCTADFARTQGYEKIGMIGRSSGAWLALIAVARFHRIDSLIAIAPPIDELTPSSMKFCTGLVLSPMLTWVLLLFRFLTGIRIQRFSPPQNVRHVLKHTDPTPTLFIYNTRDTLLGTNLVKIGDFFNQASGSSQLLLLESSGHLMALENLREGFEAIEAWFDRTMV